MKDKINILGFIEGNCSDLEREEVLAWLNSAENNKLHFEHLMALWQSVPPPHDYLQFDPDLEWDAFKANPEVNYDGPDEPVFDQSFNAPGENIQIITETAPSSKSINLLWMWLVMFLALAVIISAIWVATPPAQHIEIKELNEDIFLTLEDGTKVSAYIGSSLKTPASFRYKSKREVEMKGNILFEVANHLNQPFIIYTENAGIEVLGTKFLVLSDSISTEVSNESGLLRLFSKRDENLSIELVSGDRIKFDGINFIDLNMLEMMSKVENNPPSGHISLLENDSELQKKEEVRLNDVLTYLRRISKGRVKYGSGMNFKDNPVIDIDYEGKQVREIIRLIQDKAIVVYTTWCDGCYEIQEIIMRKQ